MTHTDDKEEMDNWDVSGQTLFAEVGQDPSVLIIAFSGFGQRFSTVSSFEFFQATATMEFSRILCRDPRRLWYHAGIDSQHDSLASTAGLLTEYIEALEPETILTMGSSMGGYAALVFGCLLKVNHVHAFGPQTCLEPDYVLHERAPRAPELVKTGIYKRFWRSPHADPDFYDIADVIRARPGETRYCIHYCKDHVPDQMSAEKLQGVNGVNIYPYDCMGHNIGRRMVKDRRLRSVIHPDSQQRIDEILGAG
jgi:pimeloyl-ACP methyl ester carboxylesterase